MKWCRGRVTWTGLRALRTHERVDAFAGFEEPQVRPLWDLAADARDGVGPVGQSRCLESGGTNKDHLRDLLSRVAQQTGLRVTPS